MCRRNGRVKKNANRIAYASPRDNVKNPNKRATKVLRTPSRRHARLQYYYVTFMDANRETPLVRTDVCINNTQFRKVVPVIIIRRTEIR